MLRLRFTYWRCFFGPHLSHVTFTRMASENIETTTQKRIFIVIPIPLRDRLAQLYSLDHGLFITKLNPNINERYLESYFKEWGYVTMCKIKSSTSSSRAYVRFSTEDEADRADWAGPHDIGGTECKVRRVVSPKILGETVNEVTHMKTKAPHRRPLGLGYMLEEPQWLEDEDDQQTKQF